MTVAELLPNSEIWSAPEQSLGLGGLCALDGRAFPLTRVKVRASLAGPCGHTVVEQHFSNPFDETLDVTWIFPLPSDGTLVELELRSGDIRVVGECLEREHALAEFDAARAAGKRTALVEKEQGETHTLSLAGLPGRSDVVVRLTLVQLIPSNDGHFRWQFPTTIAPRYTPGTPITHTGRGSQPDTDSVPNASRLSPPLRLKGGTSLDLEVEIAGPLTGLKSSLHALRMALDAGAVRVAPSTQATLNKDFILEYSTAESAVPVTRAWSDGRHTLVLLEPPVIGASQGLPRDAVFVVDISGSMQGEKIEAARTALLGALHGLRTGDRFKLLAFDDRIERFANDFAVYNDRNLQAADAWIGALEARGGTEMLEVVRESLDGPTAPGRLRTVLLITDGQSNDESRLLPAVANRRGEAVFFTLGIDTAVNAALLRSLARAGGGACELCTPHDDIDAVVARLEGRFGSAVLSGIKAAGAARPDGQTVFAGRPATLLLEHASDSVSISGTGIDGPFNANVVPARIAFPLGALWAMERVAWLEERLALKPFEEEAIRPEILRIAMQWHISSKFTSFVCVDHSTVSGGARRHVVQPAELPESWHVAEDIARPAMFFPMPSRAYPHPAQAFGASPMLYSPLPEPPESSRHIPGSSGSGGGRGMSRISAAMDGLFSRQKKAAPKQLSNAAALAESAPVQSADSSANVAGTLARTQMADGSFGADVGRTAAAVLALILCGNTRRKGDRRRTLQKAVEWLLANHSVDARTHLVAAALSVAESGTVSPDATWRVFEQEGAEGALLRELLNRETVTTSAPSS